MQQRSRILEADDKTTINALIKGLTPGQTASHLTRKKPKTIDELFHELEEYILSDDDHHRRVAGRNEAKTRKQGKHLETSIPESTKHQQCGKHLVQPEQQTKRKRRVCTQGKGKGKGKRTPETHKPQPKRFIFLLPISRKRP
jgi:hypothetical protein